MCYNSPYKGAKMSKNRELETEVVRTLNSIPMTKKAKRFFRKTLARGMEKQAAWLLLRDLRNAAEGLTAVLETIRRSRKIRL